MQILLVVTFLIFVGISWEIQKAEAVGSFSNGSIADCAEKRAEGAYYGQCKEFVNDMVNEASNGSIRLSGYQQGFANPGGIEVDSTSAVRGDIIQVTPAGSNDSTAESLWNFNDKSKQLHTAIILTNNGGGNFQVIDTNYIPYTGAPECCVHHHEMNPYTGSEGSIIKIWRLGTAIAQPSNAAISISSSQIHVGENVTFNFAATNATGFVIGINNETTRIDTNDCGGNTSYTRSFSEPGTYYAYVRAYNTIGSTDSGWLPFSVLTNNDAQITGNSIPDTMTAGHSYSVAVTVKNNGTNTWTAGQYYKLGGLIDTQYFADPRQLLDSSDSIGPGQSKTFAFTMTAPSSAGTYTIAWQMSEENVISFGETLTKIVKVEAPTVNTDKTGMVPFTPTSSTVSPTKDWTIKLSGLVNENSIPDKIYVTNSDNILQTTTCTVTENNNRSLIKVIPTNGYAAGNYTLWIRDIQSTGRTVIKEQKYMDFTVQ